VLYFHFKVHHNVLELGGRVPSGPTLRAYNAPLDALAVFKGVGPPRR